MTKFRGIQWQIRRSGLEFTRLFAKWGIPQPQSYGTILA